MVYPTTHHPEKLSLRWQKALVYVLFQKDGWVGAAHNDV